MSEDEGDGVETELNSMADRVRRRMNELSLSIAEVERRAGFSRDYLSDLLRGKKKAVSRARVGPLARALQTSVAYIQGIDEPVSKTSLPEIGEEYVVYPSISMSLTLVALDLMDGKCKFMSEDGSVALGTIVDPSLAVPNNPYVMAMASRRPMTVVAKRVKSENDERYMILDTRDAYE